MTTLRIPLLVAVALGLAVGGLALIFWPDEPGPSAGKVSQQPIASTPPSMETTHPTEEEHAHEHDTDPEQLRLVDQFGQAFGARASHKVWLAGLEPHVTAELLEGFRYTDPARRLKGKVKQVLAVAELEHVFIVTYAADEQIAVTLSTSSGRDAWVVSEVEPVKAPAQTGNDV